MDLSDKLGYPWVYQHTDSIYLNAPKYMKKVVKNQIMMQLSHWQDMDFMMI